MRDIARKAFVATLFVLAIGAILVSPASATTSHIGEYHFGFQSNVVEDLHDDHTHLGAHAADHVLGPTDLISLESGHDHDPADHHHDRPIVPLASALTLPHIHDRWDAPVLQPMDGTTPLRIERPPRLA